MTAARALSEACNTCHMLTVSRLGKDNISSMAVCTAQVIYHTSYRQVASITLTVFTICAGAPLSQAAARKQTVAGHKQACTPVQTVAPKLTKSMSGLWSVKRGAGDSNSSSGSQTGDKTRWQPLSVSDSQREFDAPTEYTRTPAAVIAAVASAAVLHANKSLARLAGTLPSGIPPPRHSQTHPCPGPAPPPPPTPARHPSPCDAASEIYFAFPDSSLEKTNTGCL